MTEPISYSFDDNLRMSNGVSESTDIATVLKEVIPGAGKVFQAEKANDRTGTDWWAEMINSDFLSVDCKVRSEDYSKKGQDDLALEIWSVVEAGKVGWTLDASKRTDYVFWFWKDTRRWCLLPFRMLCYSFKKRLESWKTDYKVARQRTPWKSGDYHSECVFVPRLIVWRAIFEDYGGMTGKVVKPEETGIEILQNVSQGRLLFND